MKILHAHDRHFSDFDWLKTYWLFSFADYYDPDNIQFGALRVFNDDVVEPKTGFPTHPHKEMEIITVVLDGEITHQDSMGNKTVIKAGDVQRMSAGTGLTHSEFNLADVPVHFYQIWIYPNLTGLNPSYEQKTFSPEDLHNRLFPIASGQNFSESVSFSADATIYRSLLDPDREIEFETNVYRRIFIYITDGEVEVNGKKIRKNEQARIDLEEQIDIKALQTSDFILIDVPSCKGFGYDKKTLRGEKA